MSNMKKKRIIAAVAIVTIGAVLYFGGSKLTEQNRVVQPKEPSEPTVTAMEKQINDIDHSATPAPKATVNPGQGSGQETPQPAVSAGSPEASAKPSEATQKPTVSQRPTPPASTPTATTEPPTASQKPNGDDSGSGDKPEVTPKPSQDQGGSDTPPSYTGKNGEIKNGYMWCDGFGWVPMATGVDVGSGGTFGEPGETLSGHKVGNM